MHFSRSLKAPWRRLGVAMRLPRPQPHDRHHGAMLNPGVPEDGAAMAGPGCQMSEAPPIMFVWQGDGFTPASVFSQREADKYYTIGERYALLPRHERSSRSHAHYFAALHEAWQNLPESLSSLYPSADHLRKRALIEAGYRDERSIVCASKAEAQRVAAFIRPMDDYAIVTVKDAVVIV